MEKLHGASITPGVDELLTEQVCFLDSSGNVIIDTFDYTYDIDNRKVYFDSHGETFIISNKKEKIYLDTFSKVTFKKFYQLGPSSTSPKFLCYQALNDGEVNIINNHGISEVRDVNKGDMFYVDEIGSLKELGSIYDSHGHYLFNASVPSTAIWRGEKYCSASFNYGYETALFVEWVHSNLNALKIGNMINTSTIGNCGDPNANVFDIYTDKFYGDDKEFWAYGLIGENCAFSIHKKEVIKQCIISGLNQAITSYSRNNDEGIEYQLPVLSETEWDQALSNISIIAFAQQIPVGMKYFNSYAIATSTTNNEYIGLTDIYANIDGKDSYHSFFCKSVTPSELGNKGVGYKKSDYEIKTYQDSNGTKYFYSPQPLVPCYSCIVNWNSNVNIYGWENPIPISSNFIALWRERYVSHEFLDYEWTPGVDI